MRRLAVMVALVSCGRVGFEPGGSAPDDSLGGDGDSGSSGDGGPSGDGGVTDSDASMPDAQAAACAMAMTLQFQTPIAISTCDGNNDRFDGCGPAGTNEVVFKFTAPSSGSYTFRARDAGTQNVSNSTGIVNEGCTATATCAGILGRPLNAGQTEYFVIEASSGGCANIEFEAI